MGVLDDFRKSFGATALDPTTTPPTTVQNWCTICTCGHLKRYHSTTIGGIYSLKPPTDTTIAGRRLLYLQEFHGCRGAMVNKGEATVIENRDMEADPPTITERFLATCTCRSFTEIAKVDRPNRYFNQRIPVDRQDPLRHPFAVGIRAFSTFLSRRRQALANPAWAEAEFDRRFEWTARRCAISKCTTTDDVWPVYINDDTSELRCAEHRP